MESSDVLHNDGQSSAHPTTASSHEPHHRTGSHSGPFTVDAGGGGSVSRPSSAAGGRHPQPVATGPHGPPLWDSLTASAAQPRRANMYPAGSSAATTQYGFPGQAVVGQNGMEWPVVRGDVGSHASSAGPPSQGAKQMLMSHGLPVSSGSMEGPAAYQQVRTPDAYSPAPNVGQWQNAPQGYMGGASLQSPASHSRYPSQEQVQEAVNVMDARRTSGGAMSRQSSRSRSNSAFGPADSAAASVAMASAGTPPPWGEGQLFGGAVHTEHTQHALAQLQQQQKARRMQSQSQQMNILPNNQAQFQQYRQVQPPIMSPLDAPQSAGYYASPLNSAVGPPTGSSAPPWSQQHFAGSASSVSSPTSYAQSTHTDPRSRTTTMASEEGGLQRVHHTSSKAPSIVSGRTSAAPSPPNSAQHVIPRRGSFGADDSALADEDLDDPETMAQKDPLATQVWKMYAREKNAKPHAARMENLTWRMMALALRKKKEEEEAAAALALQGETALSGPRTPGSHPSSRRSSGSDDPSHATFRGLTGMTSISGDSLSKAKGKARFAELQEERGRRGRSSKTPESTGSINTSAEEVMDWRATSKSRSRSRSMSNMDWRGASRSRSRAPAHPDAQHTSTHPSALQELGTIDDDDDSESLLSRSAPSQPGFAFGDFIGMVDTPPGARPSGVNNELTPGHTTGNGLTPLLSLANLPAPFGSSQSSSEDASRTASASGLDHLEFAPSAPAAGPPGSVTTPSDKARMQQAFKVAAHSDLFPMTGNLSSAVPFLYGGRKTSWDMSSIGANPLGAPLSTLGSVPGIGDYGGHSGNQHPEYGFLPRLVRKTSFDHKVRSLSRGPPQSAQALQPPPPPPHPTGNLLQQPPDQLLSPYGSSPPQPVLSRKRPYEPSPARPALRIPTSGEQRMASGLSRQAPAPFSLQGTGGSNLFGGFAAPPFDFATPEAGASHAAHGLPVPSSRGRDDKSGNANLGSSVTSTSSGTGSGRPTDDHLSSTEPSSSELEVIMNFLYNPDVRNEQAQPFTHINPSQVFRFNGASGSGQADILGGGVTEASDGESSTWTYSPANTSSPVATPGAGIPSAINFQSEGGNLGWANSQPASRRQSGENRHSGSVQKYEDEDSPGDSAKSPGSFSVGSMAKASPPTSCSNCSTTKTPLWRRDPAGQPLCNACGLFYKLHGKIRPLSLKTDVIKKRNRAQPARDKPRGSVGPPSAGGAAVGPSGQSSSAGGGVGGGSGGGSTSASGASSSTSKPSSTASSSSSTPIDTLSQAQRARISSISSHAQGRTAHGTQPVNIAPAPAQMSGAGAGAGAGVSSSMQAALKRQRRMEAP